MITRKGRKGRKEVLVEILHKTGELVSAIAIGKQDLWIAVSVISKHGVLATLNRRNLERFPG